VPGGRGPGVAPEPASARVLGGSPASVRSGGRAGGPMTRPCRRDSGVRRAGRVVGRPGRDRTGIVELLVRRRSMVRPADE
jgi:hypothetical protein